MTHALHHADHLVAVDHVRRAERQVSGDEPAVRGQRRDDEPRERDREGAREHQPARARLGAPQPDGIERNERPRLRPPERRADEQHEREPSSAGEVAVDRRQAQHRHQRIGVGDQHQLRVARQQKDPESGNHRRHPRHPGRTGLRARQPVRDPSGEHRAAERSGRGGHHPQPQLRSRPWERVGKREQKRERLPRRGAVGVQVPLQDLPAPHQPAEGVVGRTGVGPQDPADRDEHDEAGHDHPRQTAAQCHRPSRAECGG